MARNQKLPTELAAIAAVCCIGGGVLVLTIAGASMLLMRHAFPNPVVQKLVDDAAIRPLLVGEAIGVFVLAVIGLSAGILVFARAKIAGWALRTAIVFAMLCVVADVIIQGWLIVPSLRALAAGGSQLSLMYDPRFRPTLPLATGVIILIGLAAVFRTLRRRHVHEALYGDWATEISDIK